MQCPSESTLQVLARRPDSLIVVSEEWGHVKACVHCQAVMRRFGINVGKGAPVSAPGPDALATEPPTRPGPPGASPAPPSEAVAPTAASHSLMQKIERGVTIGRYVVLNPIASGSMGAVFAAYDPELDRKVALKILRVDIPGVDPDEMRARFMREAQAMARVVHPHVITVYDIGTYGPHAFFAMNFVEGGTLGTWARETERTEADIVAAYLKAGQGLAAAHAAGLVHRDFKPDNVLVSYDGHIFVTDFGLVRANDAPELGAEPVERAPVPSVVSRKPMLDIVLTEVRVLMGTPRYMAPEQMDRLDADARTDQFSYCVALFEALYGHRPFQGATLGVVRKQIEAAEVTLPDPKKRGSARLLNALLRGLSADPAKRFSSMDTLLQALSQTRPWWRRRRTVLATALAVLSVTALTIGAGMGALTHQMRVCAGADEKLNTDWNEKTQAALRQAWAAGNKAEAGDQMVAAIDRSAAAWVKASTDACEAARVRGEQSEETLALRTRCLEGHYRQWAALKRLAEGGPELVPRGAASFAFLPRVSQCADVVALREGGSGPDDAAAREKLEALDGQLARATALTAAGRPLDGLALGDSVKTAAEQLGHAPFSARLTFAQALSAVQTGDAARAKALLLDAAWQTQAAGLERLAAQAWSALALLAARIEKRPDEALKLWRQADALVRRAGTDDELKSMVLHAQGVLSAERGKALEAVDALTQALKLRIALYGEAQPETLETLEALATALKAAGKPAEALSTYDKAAAATAQLYGKASPQYAAAQLQWADAAWSEKARQGEARRAVEALKVPAVGEAMTARINAWLASHSL
ncbi:MAG: serine/threonine-protein kinase [Myxococcaceae bacterium]|nr:serine/threonine-protein kinase [Myxococcaceae bacterium]